jgi:hypothetical protein
MIVAVNACADAYDVCLLSSPVCIPILTQVDCVAEVYCVADVLGYS